MDTRTGEILLDRCKTNACLPCVRLKTKNIARAIAVSQPSHFVTLTGLNGTWTADRDTLKTWRRYLSRKGLDLHLALSIEPNPSGEGAHAHGWLWSPQVVDAGLMHDRAAQVGLGWMDVQETTSHTSLGYGLKMAGWNASAASAYRTANGRALIHARRFWRNADGEPLTQAQVITASRSYDPASTSPSPVAGPS